MSAVQSAPNARVSLDDEEEEPERRPLSLQLIRRVFSYTKPYARKRNWLLAIVLVRAGQLAGLAALFGAVIKDVVEHRDPVRLIIGTVAFSLLAIFTGIVLHYRQLLALELGEAVVHDLRNDLFRHLQRMPMNFFNRTKLGRIISRVISDCEAIRVGVQDVLFVTLVNAGQMVVSAMLMLWIDWRLFLVVLAISPILWGLNRVFHNRFSTAFRNVQESFSRVTANLAEAVNGVRVTQSYARQELNALLFKNLVLDHSHFNLAVARLRGFFLPLLDLSSQLFLACLLLVGGWLVFDYAMPYGDIIMFFFLAQAFFGPMQNVGTQYTNALTAMAGAERVFTLLDQAPEWEDPPQARELRPLRGQVRFVDVGFGYSPDKPVLKGVSFTAEPGQTIAFVGHTGSGKSTIINLIAKFYLPTSGTVLIDDVDIRELDGDSLHHQMGIVLQSNFLFTGTVMDNIRVGRPTASDQEVVDAARRLGCADLIESLPGGFRTEVGEGGGSLSLGQRQLICFTRAMLADPRILILDEATSAVDTMTEARIQKALQILLHGRTSFVVAHRLSTIRHADRVFVLDHGSIIERGKHRQLLMRGGVYADLYRQFILATDS